MPCVNVLTPVLNPANKWNEWNEKWPLTLTCNHVQILDSTRVERINLFMSLDTCYMFDLCGFYNMCEYTQSCPRALPNFTLFTMAALYFHEKWTRGSMVNKAAWQVKKSSKIVLPYSLRIKAIWILNDWEQRFVHSSIFSLSLSQTNWVHKSAALLSGLGMLPWLSPVR